LLSRAVLATLLLVPTIPVVSLLSLICKRWVLNVPSVKWEILFIKRQAGGALFMVAVSTQRVNTLPGINLPSRQMGPFTWQMKGLPKLNNPL